MTFDWNPGNEPRDDGPDSLREWRWRSYTDHLEDLGYDLDGGSEPDVDGHGEPMAPTRRAFRKPSLG